MRTEIKTSESTTYLCEKCGAEGHFRKNMIEHEKNCNIQELRAKFVGNYYQSQWDQVRKVVAVDYVLTALVDRVMATVEYMGDRTGEKLPVTSLGERVSEEEIIEATRKMKKDYCAKADKALIKFIGHKPGKVKKGE